MNSLHCATLAALAALALPGSAAAQETSPTALEPTSPWSIGVGAVFGFPAQPTEFKDGWNTGYGLEGGLRRRFGTRWEVGFEGQFVQFVLGDIPGVEVLGGARRIGRATVPVRLQLFESSGKGRDRFGLEGGIGWAYQDIETITNANPTPPTGASRGPSWCAGILYSRILYRDTRFVIGGRYTSMIFEDETPQYWSFQLGAEMPLVGSN